MTPPWSPAREIHFDKYTVAGNTFLIVDECHADLGKTGRSNFTRWALDGYFGVGGADNVLFIARVPCQPDSRTYHFRIYDWDGTEGLCCGNGLLAVTHAISRGGGAEGGSWTMLTELPTGRPNPVRVGVSGEGTWTWADLGLPRRVPPVLYQRSAKDEWSGDVSVIRFTLPATGQIEIAGRLIFTGEPHLVFVVGHGFPASLRDSLFPAVPSDESIALMDGLGRQLNVLHRARFPEGVHVSVVDAVPGALRYRTWERVIDVETLACGTGALACAHIGRMLGLTGSATSIEMRPHRGRWRDRDVVQKVTITPSGMVLAGKPVLVCRGSVPGVKTESEPTARAM